MRTMPAYQRSECHAVLVEARGLSSPQSRAFTRPASPTDDPFIRLGVLAQHHGLFPYRALKCGGGCAALAVLAPRSWGISGSSKKE